MEAEAIHGAAQRPQPPARDHAGIIRNQRTLEHVEIGLEFLHARIGRGLADRPAGGLDLQPQRGRGQAGIDAGHRQTIRFAAPVRRGVGRASGQRAQFVGNIGKMRRQRQFRAEDVQLLQIEVHHPARLQPQGAAHDVGGDERIAVAVAADPASHGQERSQFTRLAALLPVQPVFQRAMQPRHLVQERVVVERQAVGDLIQHGQLGPAQQVGLPQRQHGAAQLLVAGLDLVRRQLHPLATVEQCRDFHLAVDRALAADFGRMRGQDRADLGLAKELAQVSGAEAGRLCVGKCLRQRARPRPAGATPAHLADVVLVLGDVGEMREIAEGADDPHRVAGRHAVEDGFEFPPRQLVLVAMEPDRGLPDALDQVEHIGALLVAHGIAENPPEQADIGPQPRIFLQRQRIIAAVGPGLGRHGLGRHDLGRHGGYLRNCPAIPSVQVFCRSAR